MAEREEKLYLARLAELAERYDEMVEIMKQVVELDGDLKREDRNLLSVAYKNVIGSRRASWRVLSSIAEKANETSPVLKTYREQVERELSTICNDILDLLEQYLLPAARSSVESDKSEAIVFYLKMKGDYYRYMAEYQTGADRDATAENALMAYKSASDESIEHLSSTHPIRLGLALNYSVFYYEIIGKRERAQKLAQDAFDDAVKDLEELQQSDNYKDSTLIIQLLRDNLTLWNQGAEEGERGETTQQQNGGNDD